MISIEGNIVKLNNGIRIEMIGADTVVSYGNTSCVVEVSENGYVIVHPWRYINSGATIEFPSWKSRNGQGDKKGAKVGDDEVSFNPSYGIAVLGKGCGYRFVVYDDPCVCDVVIDRAVYYRISDGKVTEVYEGEVHDLVKQ